jgi:hypothetical protein
MLTTVVSLWHNVSHEAIRRFKANSTKLYIPLFILALRGGAERVFQNQYKWLDINHMSRYVTTFDKKAFRTDEIADLVSNEISILFDPENFHQHLPGDGFTIPRAQNSANPKKSNSNSNSISEQQEMNAKQRKTTRDAELLKKGSLQVNKARRTKFYATSAALKATVGANPQSAAARNILFGNNNRTNRNLLGALPYVNSKHGSNSNPSSPRLPASPRKASVP